MSLLESFRRALLSPLGRRIGLAATGLAASGAVALIFLASGNGRDLKIASAPSPGPAETPSPGAIPSPIREVESSPAGPAEGPPPAPAPPPSPVLRDDALLLGSEEGLYAVNPDGSALRKIIAGTRRNPAWSPDRSQIAFWADNPEGIWISRADGSERRFLVQGNRPSWSPDGLELAYECGERICVVDTRNGSVRDITPPGAETALSPAWSSKGLIAFRLEPTIGERTLEVMNGAGQERRTIVKKEEWGLLSLDWSPDGRTLVFDRKPDDYLLYDIWRIDENGSNMRPVLEWRPTMENNPRWSPEGSRIVFTHLPRGGRLEVRIITASGADGYALPLPEGKVLADPDW